MTGCGSPRERSITFGQALRVDCRQFSGEQYYFGSALQTASATVGRGSSGAFYAETFAALSEPSYLCSDGPDEGYRLMLAPRFSREIRVIRLARSGSTVAVYSATKSDRVDRHPARSVTSSEWQLFQSSLNELDFWLQPTLRLHGPRPNAAGFDGSDWLLEGRAGARYHVIVRGSGQLDAPFSGVARMLVSLAGLDIGDELTPVSQ